MVGAFRRGLPLEDLSIGFQLKMFRVPNVYNFRFWNHFTNNEFIKVNNIHYLIYAPNKLSYKHKDEDLVFHLNPYTDTYQLYAFSKMDPF